MAGGSAGSWGESGLGPSSPPISRQSVRRSPEAFVPLSADRPGRPARRVRFPLRDRALPPSAVPPPCFLLPLPSPEGRGAPPPSRPPRSAGAAAGGPRVSALPAFTRVGDLGRTRRRPPLSGGKVAWGSRRDGWARGGVSALRSGAPRRVREPGPLPELVSLPPGSHAVWGCGVGSGGVPAAAAAAGAAARDRVSARICAPPLRSAPPGSPLNPVPPPRDNSRLRPQIRRDDPLNLSILLSGGKETNKDSLSSGERRGKSPAPNPRPTGGRGTCGVRKTACPVRLGGLSPPDRGSSRGRCEAGNGPRRAGVRSSRSRVVWECSPKRVVNSI